MNPICEGRGIQPVRIEGLDFYRRLPEDREPPGPERVKPIPVPLVYEVTDPDRIVFSALEFLRLN
jgi:hypothetical protein